MSSFYVLGVKVFQRKERKKEKNVTDLLNYKLLTTLIVGYARLHRLCQLIYGIGQKGFDRRLQLTYILIKVILGGAE